MEDKKRVTVGVYYRSEFISRRVRVKLKKNIHRKVVRYPDGREVTVVTESATVEGTEHLPEELREDMRDAIKDWTSGQQYESSS